LLKERVLKVKFLGVPASLPALRGLGGTQRDPPKLTPNRYKLSYYILYNFAEEDESSSDR